MGVGSLLAHMAIGRWHMLLLLTLTIHIWMGLGPSMTGVTPITPTWHLRRVWCGGPGGHILWGVTLTLVTILTGACRGHTPELPIIIHAARVPWARTLAPGSSPGLGRILWVRVHWGRCRWTRLLLRRKWIIKVHLFWQGHKILRNLHLTFDWHYMGQK